jgi:glutathione synthase/RimK-type ligase-like ATP-grasp enzyme
MVGVHLYRKIRKLSRRGAVTPPPAQAGRFIGIRPFPPEPELADRCCRLTAKPGLVVAGISLRRTPAGRWFCCEVNRSPGFAVCQHAAGGRVAEAIVDLLAVKRRIG